MTNKGLNKDKKMKNILYLAAEAKRVRFQANLVS